MAGAGYEDQHPLGDEVLADPDARLRDAFAQLLAQRGSNTPFPALGDPQAVPVEALWAAQGRQQLPKQSPAEAAISRHPATGDRSKIGMYDLPTRQITPDTEAFARQAMPGNGRRDNPWLTADPAPAPFHGKGKVVGPHPKPYELPEKKKKKSEKGKD